MPKIKSEAHRHHLKWLAACLLKRIPKNSPSSWPQALIPVPISPKKQLIKGYNQTEFLARQLSAICQCPTDTSIVKKIKNTPAQATLTAKERKTNLTGAFHIADNNYQHLAIIDDVMTTGSTANEIARGLVLSGVKRVDVWVIARTPA